VHAPGAGVDIATGTTAGAGSVVRIANNLNGDTLTISGSLGSQAVTYASGTSAKDIAASINAATDNTGVSVGARTNVKIDNLTQTGTVSFSIVSDNQSSVAGEVVSASITDTSDLTALANAINQKTASTGVYATVSDDKASILLTNESGEDINLNNVTHSNAAASFDLTLVDYDGGFDATSEVTAAGTTVVGNGTNDANAVGLLQFNASSSFTVVATTGTDYFNGTTAVGSGLNSVSSVDISTQAGAQEALAVLDNAIKNIDSIRGGLGAVQNRFQSTISNLESIRENAAAARSRIRDADYASETATLAKNQVLQQAGLSVLAQANASSQSVLSLLQ